MIGYERSVGRINLATEILLLVNTNMDDTDLRCLEIDFNGSNAAKILRRFVDDNALTFTFEDLSKNGKRQRLFNIIFKYLQKAEMQECHIKCLESLRILSRDKTGLNDVLDESKIAVLLKLSCLYTIDETSTNVMELSNTDIIVEALKVLCNLVFNSTVAATLVSQTHAIEGILVRLRMYREPGVPENIKLFDMKLLFLITALCPNIRPKLKEEFHGLVYLTETLDLILKESAPSSKNEHRVRISDSDADLCCEILKVIFNLMTKRMSIGDASDAVEDQEEALCLRLTSILHDLLISEVSDGKRNEVRNHTVNLLTSVPFKCYSEMTTPAVDDLPKEFEYNGRSMEAIEILLEFLNDKLTPEKSKGKQELLSPILTVLLNLVKNQRLVRKFLRYRILPPLKDVWTRPEEGDSLRAKLCRLLTSTSTTVKDLTAEFLFTLCKENVGRMVKYTGYGNAAGMFATRGLMLGNPRSNSSSSSYSSDSDSDTEEYIKYADQINPVVGRCEPPRPNPMEGMSEEQKEYEALKLANMMDKLSREGIVQPCRIGEDGRPQPVEHILQLQEDLPRQQFKPKK
ncbi:UNVERIFIED_CONTAM: hypothetical protein PYX00_005604 [Menopon gallinae]|uniref:Synembryn-A n=1 Tax=Menopon gallinae TaxID=328185 RepID=A0AAW2HT26_9NEOP